MLPDIGDGSMHGTTPSHSEQRTVFLLLRGVDPDAKLLQSPEDGQTGGEIQAPSTKPKDEPNDKES